MHYSTKSLSIFSDTTMCRPALYFNACVDKKLCLALIFKAFYKQSILLTVLKYAIIFWAWSDSYLILGRFRDFFMYNRDG